MAAQNEELEPSELGTKLYWNGFYVREAANYSIHGGIVWFEEAGAEEKVLAYLEAEAESGVLKMSGQSPTSFLDLGTGNGHMLFALREDGWTGKMVGVDYSSRSVELCELIRDQRSKDLATDVNETENDDNGKGAENNKGEPATGEKFDDLVFYQWDIFSPHEAKPVMFLEAGFDVVLDKGTFDAISLLDQTDERGRRFTAGYAARVEPLIAPGGRFIITSCNWAEPEVRRWIEQPGGKLKFKSRIPYPNFTFGGKTGSSVCTVIFEKMP